MQQLRPLPATSRRYARLSQDRTPIFWLIVLSSASSTRNGRSRRDTWSSEAGRVRPLLGRAGP